MPADSTYTIPDCCIALWATSFTCSAMLFSFSPLLSFIFHPALLSKSLRASSAASLTCSVILFSFSPLFQPVSLVCDSVSVSVLFCNSVFVSSLLMMSFTLFLPLDLAEFAFLRVWVEESLSILGLSILVSCCSGSFPILVLIFS